MNTNEFLDFFEKKCQALKPYLQGVLAIDMLSNVKKLKKGHFIIFNASKRNSKGTHWTALTRSLDGKYIVFDSLGRDLDSKGAMNAVTQTDFKVTQTDFKESSFCILNFYLESHFRVFKNLHPQF